MWLIVGQLPIKTRWWNAPLAHQDFSQSNKQKNYLIPRIPTLIPRITHIPNIPTPIPRIPTLIPHIPTLIPRVPTLILRVPIIPLISLPVFPFRLLQIAQKVDGKMIFTGYWKVLVLNFSLTGNTVFLRQKVNGKMIFTDYWNVLVLGYRKVLVLNLSPMGNTVFVSQKVDVKIIFTWPYWAFHDIPGPGG